jgi:CRP-like cAMP-binding protein
LGPGSIQFRQFQVDFEKVLDSNRIVAGLSKKDNKSPESIAQEGAYSKR